MLLVKAYRISHNTMYILTSGYLSKLQDMLVNSLNMYLGYLKSFIDISANFHAGIHAGDQTVPMCSTDWARQL